MSAAALLEWMLCSAVSSITYTMLLLQQSSNVNANNCAALLRYCRRARPKLLVAVVVIVVLHRRLAASTAASAAVFQPLSGDGCHLLRGCRALTDSLEVRSLVSTVVKFGNKLALYTALHACW
jgi:hypothetical protein